MGRIFKRVKYSDYLGENRALLDIYVGYIEDAPPPSEGFFILFETGNIMTAENNNEIEYQH